MLSTRAIMTFSVLITQILITKPDPPYRGTLLLMCW